VTILYFTDFDGSLRGQIVWFTARSNRTRAKENRSKDAVLQKRPCRQWCYLSRGNFRL